MCVIWLPISSENFVWYAISGEGLLVLFFFHSSHDIVLIGLSTVTVNNDVLTKN